MKAYLSGKQAIIETGIKKKEESIKQFFDTTKGILMLHSWWSPDGGHYFIAVGYSYNEKGKFLVHVVDSSYGTTVSRFEAYKFTNPATRAKVDNNYHTGQEYYLALNGNWEIKYGAYTSSSASGYDYGTEVATLHTIVRTIKDSCGLYSNPYIESEKKFIVDKKTMLNVLSIVKNNAKPSYYWLKVSYKGKVCYICANMVEEYFIGPRQDVWIEGNWVAGIDYPSGNYAVMSEEDAKSDRGTGIPLHGTIKSNYPIKSITGGWYLDAGLFRLPIPYIDLKTGKADVFIRTVPASGEYTGYDTKSVAIKSSNINTLNGRYLRAKGKGSYVYQLSVTYWKYKNVTSDSEIPLQEGTWTSEKMPFTIGGESNEVVKGGNTDDIPVTSIALNTPSATIEVGANIFLSPTVKPDNATNKRVNWSSNNENVATVKDGKVTGVTTGTAIITAKADDDSGKTATCTVTVIKKVSGLTVSPSTVSLYVNDSATAKLTENILPADASNKSVTWSSSNSSIVSVDQDGNITAKAVGSATITAKANDGSGKQGICQVTVRAYVDTVTLSGNNYVNAGSSIKLASAITPENAENKELIWRTSDANIATVDNAGNVKGVQTGTVTITATAADRGIKSSSYIITVLQPVTEITLSGESTALKGKTVTLAAFVQPSNASNKTIMWASEDTSIAIVNEGIVNAVSAGDVTIWASATDGSGVKTPFNIRVLQPVTDISINGEEIVPVDGTINLNASIAPANADNRILSWTSSDPAIASVNSQGVVTGLQPGSAVITASATDGSDISKEKSIQVIRKPIAIKIEGENIVHTGSSVQLIAIVSSEDPLPDKSVTWSSSDPAIVTVNDNGVLTGVSNGTAVITATSNAESYYYAMYQVSVDTLISQISVSGINEIDKGNASQLMATVTPTTASNKQLIWKSSNSAVASVDSQGKVQGLAAGTVNITAAANDGSGVEATLKITVYPLPDQIIISGETDLLVNTSAQLSVEILPENARNRSVIWSSSDTTVATVDANGLVTAISNGSTVITATASGNTAVTGQHELKVTTQVSTVTLDAPKQIDVGDMQKVTATVLPETASNQQLVWSSSDKDVAVVDANGNVFGIAGGFVTIAAKTADGSDIVAEAEIQIFQYIQSVSVDVEPIAYVGQTIPLYTIILPEDVSDPYVTWTSSNVNVVRLEEFESESDYEIQAVCLNPGVARITATAKDGSGVSGYAYIQVYPYTELARNTATYNIYIGGETNSRIGQVSLSADCSSRAAEDKYGVVWCIEHVNGDNAAALGINERTYTFSGFTLANGVDLVLLGVNSTGSDTYRVTCTINGQADTCLVTVNVEEPAAPLPDSVSLPITAYSAKVGEEISMNVTPVVSPATAALPDDANPFLYGLDAFNRYAQVNMGENVFTVTFSKAGVYTAYVRYQGTNYQYDAYITFNITTKEGTIPPEVESLSINNSVMYLLPGETAEFDVEVYPSGADKTTLQWSSSDPEVVTIAAEGTMTAVSPGTSIITVSAGNGASATGFVAVTESLLSIDWNQDDVIEVYVGGEARTVIQKVYLTPRASAQLTKDPEWSIKRQYGSNLTLICEPITATSTDGKLLYGCAIILKSVSSSGTTEYELTCRDGEYTASTMIQVNANNIENNLPSLIQWSNSTFSCDANECLTICPMVQSWPAGTTLPDEAVIYIEGDTYWDDSLQKSEYTVSRGMITVVFDEPGIYTANCVYSCSNMRYVVPIVVRVADENGNVPVRLMQVTLNESEISIEEGTSFQLAAFMNPADATDKTLRWSSDDTSVATVDENGLVTAVSDGQASIWCIPNDPNCRPAKCVVVVENAFTINKYTEMDYQYLQGAAGYAVAGFKMSTGTAKRIDIEGSTLEWNLSRISGDAAEVELQEREGAQYIVVTELRSGGTDTYEISCSAGEHRWSEQVTLEIADLGVTAPETVSLQNTNYTAEVGEEVELDFTPICAPAGTRIPSQLRARYVRAGNLLESLVDEYYRSVRTATGDKVKVAFKRPGTYLMSRYYTSRNLTYVTECTIHVGDGSLDLLRCSDVEPVVYIGGKSSIVTTCFIADTSIEELYGDSVVWTAERLSGDCLTVALRGEQSGASLYVANAKSTGSEEWRVSCSFKGITDYVDVTIHAVDARTQLPESAMLYQSQFDGMIGIPVVVPLSVQCEPEEAALPTTTSEDWTFMTDGNTSSNAAWTINGNQMSICFRESGYYGGRLVYESGNVSYSFPISFAITDEESVQARPEYMDVSVSSESITVYPEGETGIPIVKAVLSNSLSSYSLSSIAAYADRNNAVWSLEMEAGSACGLSVSQISASSAQIILDSISGPGDVGYTITCTVAGESYSAQGNIHIAAENEPGPEPVAKQTYFTTPVGTLLTIDASFYDRHSNLKLCSGADSVWENETALAAMGFSYRKAGDMWLPTFYEAGTYVTTITNMTGNLRCSQNLTIAVYTQRKLPESYSRLTFPKMLQEIESEGFAQTHIHVIDLRGSGVRIIHSRAFADNPDLMRVYIPSGVEQIGSDAFEGCVDFIICCDQGSYAESWAKQAGYPVIVN